MVDAAKPGVVFLGLGSNLGDRLANMRAAVSALSDDPRIHIDLPNGPHDHAQSYNAPEPRASARAVSRRVMSRAIAHGHIASLYETSPVGGAPGQPAFLNSAVRVTTTLSPHELLDVVLSIEAACGRVRPDPGGARVIDIDLLLYDDTVINDDRLSLPHPRLHERRFVLEPLSEIAEHVVQPILKLTIIELARRQRDRSTDETVVLADGPTWWDKTDAKHRELTA